MRREGVNLTQKHFYQMKMGLIVLSSHLRVRCSWVFQITAVLPIWAGYSPDLSRSQTKAVYRGILMTMENTTTLRKHMFSHRQLNRHQTNKQTQCAQQSVTQEHREFWICFYLLLFRACGTWKCPPPWSFQMVRAGWKHKGKCFSNKVIEKKMVKTG